MPLEVEITSEPDDGKRISLTGSLDTDTAPQLQDRIEESINTSVKTIILDMKYLEFISSAGLRVIFKTNKLMSSRSGKLLFVNLQPQVRKVFEIIKAAGSMNIFQDEAELDEYLAEMQRQVLEGE